MAFESLREQIKETPVSMIIGQFIPLNKKGANLEAICPFHPDSHPSLKVSDTKGMYKCFVCGEGGDAITFVKEFKRVDFVEALRIIAGILGLQFDEVKKEKSDPRKEMGIRVLSASVKLYQKHAAQNPKPFTDFLESRKLNETSVTNFQIGFSPANNALLNYLQTIPSSEREFALNTAHEIGMIKYNADRDSHYDFYRDRIMFPIHDHSGIVKGYSSRSIRDDQNPKYLNSGESFIFNKGSVLFGFCFAKNVIRQLDQVIIVEGNMDLIMMHQYGFTQTVGAMGTAFSVQSVRLLANMTKQVYLGMDSDSAGKKAMSRINADFMAAGVLPKLLNYEPAKDPDEFLLKEGRLALLERIEKAPILLDVLIAELLPDKPLENTEVKLATLQQAFEIISPLKEHLSATERIVTLAKNLGLKSDPATILQDYKDYLSRQKEKTPALPKRPAIEEQEEIIAISEAEARKLQVEPSTPSLEPMSNSEKLFIREIVCHPEFLTHLGGDESLAYLRHLEVKKLVQWLVNIYSEIDDTEYVPIVQDELQSGAYGKEIRDIGTDALFNHGNRYNEKVIQRMLKDYKLNLMKDQLKSKRKDLVFRQKSAPTQNEIDLILSEISKLDKEMHNLKNLVP
ncbi:MAG TPA: DNA primase [Bacteriovoracaceae bacterium]|nr:DNA primase [Bacteriovoracaceae bacterium]